MPRIRSVKPEYWDDRKLARSVSRDGRLLYIGLWNHADEHSRVQGDPRFIKGRVFPYDDDLDETAIAALLDELADAGRIVRYTVDGDPYLVLPTLSRHQRLEAAKVPSRLPSPADADPEPPARGRADESEPRADESARGESDIGDALNHSESGAEGTSREGEQDPHPPETPSEGSSGTREGTSASEVKSPQVNASTQTGPDESARDADESARIAALAGGREQVAGSREQGGAGGGAPNPEPDPPKPTRTGTRLPDDFAVTAEMAAWAREKAPTCGSEDHAAFCDYWRAKPGKDGRKTDWVATWRNWMRKEHERRAARGRPRTPTSPPGETVFDRARQRLNATPGGAP
ncbi:hypothetical protein AB0I72_19755 [Nocardiopsis sp. NPDC049922]|uniref:hypothetical protein n=1 Tax=Nocardiopsis sp. NPDC049922 TaxID=3155157 RepID=UPI0033C98C8E